MSSHRKPMMRRRLRPVRRPNLAAGAHPKPGQIPRAAPSRSPAGTLVRMAGQTRYARSGNYSIAYQVVGEGPFDLLWVPGFVSNVELAWEEPLLARFLDRLASFSRLVLFDKRGTGMSDRLSIEQLPTLEDRLEDVIAVLDAAGSERTALFGHSEGGNLAVLFAATHPSRTVA